MAALTYRLHDSIDGASMGTGKRLSNSILADQDRVLNDYKRDLLSLLDDGTQGPLLDLGCGPGTYTLIVALSLGLSGNTLGIDIDDGALRSSKEKGIQVIRGDLDAPFPFADAQFNVILSSQVIEHVRSCDHFVSEIFRVLKPSGYAIIATENLASWHNILSLILGYQPFTENVSEVRRIGNPFAPNWGEPSRFDNRHTKVMTLFSFQELLALHNLRVVGIRCSGYPPVPHPLSRLFSRLDPRHSRYLIVKARRA